MSDGQQSELQRLREEVRALREKLTDIEHRLEGVSVTPPPVIPVTPPEMVQLVPNPPVALPPIISTPPPITRRAPPVTPKESFEVRLGTYWLPRIGMVLLLTGVAFFAAYYFPKLSVTHKVALSYLCCAVMGGLGLWLEKKLPAFARVLVAGSLAMAYFVTYASHFVEAFRIIESPTMAIALLSVVVGVIVAVAQERQSPGIAGMALFFGYYTSLVSGVATFTLAANAVLALAALFFLWRNRWVPITYGAVLATYLAYMLWVWKVNHWGGLDRILWGAGYLSAEDFRLRAMFLSLYWLLFAAGGLLTKRETMAPAERNGLFTLNNAFFFLLFTLLMHHAFPHRPWVFFFPFAGVLLVTSALAYQRFAPDRSALDVLFIQGLLVATLGVLGYFKGVRLVAALSVESIFVLLLARWLASPWLAWIARATLGIGAVVAWDRYPHWDAPMIWSATFGAIIGFVCARMENRRAAKTISLSALYFALVATALLMTAAREQFGAAARPWVWTLGAVAVALMGALLRTGEIGWAAMLPLAWAHATFHFDRLDNDNWTLAQSLALIAVTFGFGLVRWARARATDEPQSRITANRALRPYAIAAIIAILVTTIDYAPERWRLTVFAVETLIFMIAALRATETLFVGLALATMVTGGFNYWLTNPDSWVNLLAGLILFVVAERLFKRRMSDLLFYEQTCRRLRMWMVVIVTCVAINGLAELTNKSLLTVVWAIGGFVLLTLGFAAKERFYRIAGLATLALCLTRVILYDLGRFETIYRILSCIALGAILLVLAFLYAKNREKLAKWL